MSSKITLGGESVTSAASLQNDNAIRMAVVTTPEQFMHAMAIRAICFMEQSDTTFQKAIDGNDYQATHILAYAGDEPIGATRLRWFRDFAKIERTAFRPAYRSPRILKRCSDFIFDHVARKGYSTLLTHAEPGFARVWEMVLGFQRVEAKPLITYEGKEPLVEMVKYLGPRDDALSIDSEPNLMFRIEGHWEKPHPFENAND